jgi:hypothetical protein
VSALTDEEVIRQFIRDEGVARHYGRFVEWCAGNGMRPVSHLIFHSVLMEAARDTRPRMAERNVTAALARVWSSTGAWRRLEASSADGPERGAYCTPLAGRGSQTFELLALGPRCPGPVRDLARLRERSGWQRFELIGTPGRPPDGYCERPDGSGVSLRDMDGYGERHWLRAWTGGDAVASVSRERLRTVRGLRAMAWQFHVGLGVHGGWFPQAPTTMIPGHLHKARQDLLEEEVRELAEAIEARDIVKVADALGDITYVVAGTALTYGIDLDLVLDAVHASNMTKDNVPGYDKLVKGDGYEPPAIGAALDRMRRGPRKIRRRWPLSMLDGRKFFS